MTIRHFKIFIAVCDTMNMTSAAKSMYISQSAVSQAIAEMERYYGLCLFERLSRKLYLTKAGESLLGYARHMIRMNLELEKEMESMNESGSFRVGASVTVGAHVLPALVSAFMRINSRAAIEVVEDNTERIEKLILCDELDLALVEGEIVSPDIKKQDFMEDELILICSPEHRFAGLKSIAPNELEKEKFILREKGSGTRKLFEDTMAAHQLNWKSCWICSNADTIRNAVAENIGISVISKLSAAEQIQAGKICRIEIEGVRLKRKFRIIYHKNKYISGSMKQFIDLSMSSVD